MDLQGLLSRVRDLQDQLGHDKQTLNVLTEQLEQAKASFHMTNGRIQEIAHLVEMEQKLIQQAAAEAAAKKAEEQKAVMDLKSGDDNGKVIEHAEE